jgi:hypothetical protein
MGIFITILAVVAAAVVTVPVAFFAVLFLVGPHGGALPTSLRTFTLVLGWIAVIAAPVLVGRWAWRRWTDRRR